MSHLPGTLGDMERQLALLEDEEHPADWRLDDDTRELGRAGVAAARAALASLPRPAAA